MADKCNDGIVTSKGSGKTTFREAYGKDSSDYCGTAKDERGGISNGGVDNLAHSLTGASPKQRGA